MQSAFAGFRGSSNLRYPENLDQSLDFPHVLSEYAERLVNEAPDVFEPSQNYPLYFCKLTVGKDGRPYVEPMHLDYI
jgi:hypothetical protein